MMARSLRLRILLMTLMVSLAAIAAVGLLSSRATSERFEQYVATGEQIDLERFRELLSEHYVRSGGWQNVEPLLARIKKISGKEVLLLDGEGRFVASSSESAGKPEVEIKPDDTLHIIINVVENGPDRQPGQPRRVRQEERILLNPPRIILDDTAGRRMGTLYVASINPGRATERQAVFMGSVNRSLIISALVAAAVALIATLLLSRRILAPVVALTRAAREMARGDLGQRVDVRSSDEIGELARAFNAMSESLARAEQLRRNMVNDIAHELRTPLTKIRCQIEMLQEGLVSADPGTLGLFEEEAILLQRLIDDLEDLARAEAGQLKLEKSPTNIGEEIESIAAGMRPIASEQKLFLTVQVEESLPEVCADPARVRQAIGNLLSNALKHTPAGGEILISAALKDSEIEIMVKDNGAGIPAEHLPFIFERFYRADLSRARSTGGAGLGLAIVKHLAEAHGGRAWAESVAATGSSFFISLPLSS
jgi:signal transduction histidine kinase